MPAAFFNLPQDMLFRYRVIRKAMPKRAHGSRLTKTASFIQSFDCARLLTAGKAAALEQKAALLVDKQSAAEAYYYLGLARFLLDKPESALVAIQDYLARNPGAHHAVYLLADIETRLGNKEAAWTTLEKISRTSSGSGACFRMSALVENQADHDRLLSIWTARRKNAANPRLASKIATAMAMSALRIRNYEEAKALYRDIIRAAAANPAAQQEPEQHGVYSARLAEQALSDLKRILEGASIDMFLVSGTLLGCIREGRLLGHDKDIDVGIWDSVPHERLLHAIAASGCFYILPSRTPLTVRLRHVNSSAIDIFYHHIENGQIWHGGLKIKWRNRPFTLCRRKFLGETYLIPEDFDTYLTENYGSDWRTPKTDFDSALETPNAVIVNNDEFTIHLYKMLCSCIIDGKADGASRYINKLGELGENEFIKDIRIY